jgi:hypothetical protein
MTGYDWRDFVLDVTEKCDVTNRWLALGCELTARVEHPFVATVSKEQSPALMRCWEDD